MKRHTTGLAIAGALLMTAACFGQATTTTTSTRSASLSLVGLAVGETRR